MRITSAFGGAMKEEMASPWDNIKNPFGSGSAISRQSKSNISARPLTFDSSREAAGLQLEEELPPDLALQGAEDLRCNLIMKTHHTDPAITSSTPSQQTPGCRTLGCLPAHNSPMPRTQARVVELSAGSPSVKPD
jgi:hypothetical protein